MTETHETYQRLDPPLDAPLEEASKANRDASIAATEQAERSRKARAAAPVDAELNEALRNMRTSVHAVSTLLLALAGQVDRLKEERDELSNTLRIVQADNGVLKHLVELIENDRAIERRLTGRTPE